MQFVPGMSVSIARSVSSWSFMHRIPRSLPFKHTREAFANMFALVSQSAETPIKNASYFATQTKEDSNCCVLVVVPVVVGVEVGVVVVVRLVVPVLVPDDVAVMV